MPTQPKTMLAGAGNCVFMDMHPVFVGMFWGQTSVEQGTHFLESAQTFVSRHSGRPHCVLTVVTADSTTPSVELRGLLRDAITVITEDSTCYAGVILGKGVKATALRAIMGTLLMAMRHVSKGRVCSSIEDGLRWCDQHSQGLDVERVRAAIEVHGPAVVSAAL